VPLRAWRAVGLANVAVASSAWTGEVVTLDPKAAPDARVATLQQLVRQLNKDGAPILCGPFYSELGFEAIYWTPFLAWFRKHVTNFDQRAIIITRGGAGVLYTNIAGQGVDLYALRSVTDVRRAALKQQRKTGLQKQTDITPFDQAVIQDAAKQYGHRLPYHVLHPSLMYWACAPFWDETAGLRYLQSMCEFAPLPPPNPPLPITLPEKFVAVKFYARHTFPYPHPETAEFVKRTVATIAAQVPVVVLESSDAYDDHTDIAVVGPNIGSLGAKVDATQNLWVASAVIARATAFVGTYGGMAQLALRMGRPSVSFYHDWSGIGHAHFSLNSWLSKTGNVPFLVGSLSDSHLWGQITAIPAPVAKATVPMMVQV
jgi:hypothetical protein